MNTSSTENSAAAGETSAAKEAAQPRKHRTAREPKVSSEHAGKFPALEAKANPAAKELGPSKIATVIALLEREQGATLAEMVEATGWLPHTTRAALTGLKKKGHLIGKNKRVDATHYCIAKGRK